MTQDELKAREVLREWFRTRIASQERFSLPELVTEAIEHFGEDARFLRALFQESLRMIVYDIGSGVVKGTRDVLLFKDGEAVNLARTTPGEAKQERSRSVFATWVEHAGENHVRLLDMNKQELLQAAQERFRRAQEENTRGSFLMELRKGLKGSKERVRDRYQETDLEKLWGRLTSKDEAA